MTTTDSDEGFARLVLLNGVTLLHPEDAVFEAMLEGWARQQRGGRRLQAKTISDRLRVVRQFNDFADAYPWNWSAAAMDEWTTYLIAELRRAGSTVRNYQGAVRLFCDYVTSPHYQWPQECELRFGTHPVQICHEWNTAAHLVDYEGEAGRRPMTREEIQLFLDHADGQVERAVRLGRKGALAAYRDATLFKVIYGWGLRCTETSKLDVSDWYRNPKAPELGRFGSLHVRYGKRSKGSPPRRRNVLSVMPWAVAAVDDYVANIRPRYRTAAGAALWPTERGGRLQSREIEDGADPAFVQRQVGHRYASTTALYTGVSGDFMNTMMRKVLDRALHHGP